MKFTEGSFAKWGYELAAEEFGDDTVTEKRLWDELGGQMPDGKILVKDRIADSVFQQIQTRPDEYSVFALPNLNGDYLSDAAIALVGGLGLDRAPTCPTTWPCSRPPTARRPSTRGWTRSIPVRSSSRP